MGLATYSPWACPPSVKWGEHRDTTAHLLKGALGPGASAFLGRWPSGVRVRSWPSPAGLLTLTSCYNSEAHDSLRALRQRWLGGAPPPKTLNGHLTPTEETPEQAKSKVPRLRPGSMLEATPSLLPSGLVGDALGGGSLPHTAPCTVGRKLRQGIFPSQWMTSPPCKNGRDQHRTAGSQHPSPRWAVHVSSRGKEGIWQRHLPAQF